MPVPRRGRGQYPPRGVELGTQATRTLRSTAVFLGSPTSRRATIECNENYSTLRNSSRPTTRSAWPTGIPNRQHQSRMYPKLRRSVAAGMRKCWAPRRRLSLPRQMAPPTRVRHPSAVSETKRKPHRLGGGASAHLAPVRWSGAGAERVLCWCSSPGTSKPADRA
jgi:hypothetical protein